MKHTFALPSELTGEFVQLRRADSAVGAAHLDCFKAIWPEATRWLDYAYGSANPPPDDVLLQNLAQWTFDWKDLTPSPGRMWHYHIFRKGDGRLGGLITFLVVQEAPIVFSMHWVMRPTLAGQGLTTEAAQILAAELLRQPDVSYIMTTIEEDNVASRRVAEKAGFVPAAEHTQWEVNGLGHKVPFHGYVRKI